MRQEQAGLEITTQVPAIVLCLGGSAALYVAFTFSAAAKRVSVRRAQNAAANDVSNCVVESLANFEARTAASQSKGGVAVVPRAAGTASPSKDEVAAGAGASRTEQ